MFLKNIYEWLNQFLYQITVEHFETVSSIRMPIGARVEARSGNLVNRSYVKRSKFKNRFNSILLYV